MSKTAAAGSVKISPNVPGKRLGVKIYAGEEVKNGNIIVRQRGTVFHAGKNTKLSRDHSIYAISDGYVDFRRMSGHKRGKYFVDVVAESTNSASSAE